MKGSYVCPFPSSPWSMTSLYGKGLEKVVKLRNVNLKKNPLEKVILSSQVMYFKTTYFVPKDEGM